MADFAAVIRKAVALADTVTESLQTTVQHGAWPGSDGYGTPLRTPTFVTRSAIVDWKQAPVRMPDGTMVMSRAQVTFLEPVTVTVLDTIILPDGTTGPILALGGVVDPATKAPYFAEVSIG